MVIWRSDEPSMAFAILICAPDICRISFILVPWRPIMQPISCNNKIAKTFNRKHGIMHYLSYMHLDLNEVKKEVTPLTKCFGFGLNIIIDEIAYLAWSLNQVVGGILLHKQDKLRFEDHCWSCQSLI